MHVNENVRVPFLKSLAMITDRCESLINRIRIAFANTAPPNPDSVVIPTSDDEGTESVFGGKRVYSISQEAFVAHCTALWFFTDDALVYYLPGFMTAALRGADTLGVIWGHVYAQLAEGRRPAVFAKINDEQRSCVLEFCRRCGASDEDLVSLIHAFKLRTP